MTFAVVVLSEHKVHCIEILGSRAQVELGVQKTKPTFCASRCTRTSGRRHDVRRAQSYPCAKDKRRYGYRVGSPLTILPISRD